MNADGSGQKNITNTPGVEWVYYTYKDRVFFISDKDSCHRCYFLYEMDAEGKNWKKLSDLQLEDSWMGSRRDGKEMIVLGRIGNQTRHQLFLVNLENGHYRQLTNDTISSKADPVFLPGGEEFVFRYRPDRKLRQTVPAELWIRNIDGTNMRQLTHYPKDDTTAKWFHYHAGPPQWNPRYEFISYLSRQRGRNQVFAITADGKKRWPITSGDMNSGWHSWSPDGEWLVMDRAGADEKGYDIYLMEYKTGKIMQLTRGIKFEQGPVFVEIRK
jgi:TolB protein